MKRLLAYWPWFCIAGIVLMPKASGASSAIDSLENELDQTSKSTERVALLSQLCDHYYNVYKLEKALDYGQQALELATKLQDLETQAKIHKSIGNIYYLKDDYPNALEQYLEALNLAKELDDHQRIASLYNNIGIIYFKRGSYDEALEYYFKALPLFEDQGRKKALGTLYNNLGRLYDVQDNFEKALNYYQSSIDIKKALEEKAEMATINVNLGNIYYKRMEKKKSIDNAKDTFFNKALAFYRRSLKLAKEQDIKRYIARAYTNISRLYKEKDWMNEALDNQEQSLEINKAINNKSGLVYSYLGMGEIYKKQKDWLKAIDYYEQGRQIAAELNQQNELKNAYQGLSKLYDTIGNYQKAYHARSKLGAIKDTLFNQEKTNQIQRLEMAEKRRKAEKQQRLEEKREQRRNRIQYSGILIFIVFMFVSVFFTGKFTFHQRIAEGMIFISFILLFEFLLVVLDPKIDALSGGAPLIKLVANAILATCIFPLHSLFEEKLKKRVVKQPT